MIKTSIGPPVLPLERDLESQLEDVPMVEVVRVEDREAMVHADRKEGRMHDGREVAKQKTNTTKRNRQRKKHRRSQAKQMLNDSQNQSINSQVTNDNHLIHINLTSLSSSTGVSITYTCTSTM